jgi:hypothetical protein
MGSGSGSGPDCSTFMACGGNLVGTWNLTKACFGSSFNPLAGSCPASAFSGSESLSGTITFQQDGSYSSDVTALVVEDIGVPSSCINGLSCAQLQAAINMPKDAGAQPMGTCTTTATGCACHVTQASGPTTATGTYSTLGTSVTTTQTGGTPATSPYCVQGKTLLVQTEAGMMGAPGSGTLTIAATKP